LEVSWLGIGAALVLVALNGFFVATEFAIVKVRRTRLDELAKAGVGGAIAAKQVVEELDAYLSATQLGITLASLGLGWLGEPAFARLLEPLFSRFGLEGAAVHAAAIAVSFTLITFLHIVFGELAPKSLAIQKAEGVTLWVARPMKAFHFLFFPAIWALNSLAALALRLAGLRPAGETERAHSEEELRLIVAAMRTRGGAPKERLDMLERALELPSRTAKDLMVARNDVTFLRLDQTAAEHREIAVRSGHTRFPVCDEDLDHVVGILNLRDLYLRGEEPKDPAELRAVLREPYYVPESMRAEVLLREFRRRRQHMALVVDEYGGTAGIVTSEDVVTAVMGEVQDEFATWGPPVVAKATGIYTVDPTMAVDEFARHFGFELPEDDGEEVSTVGGLVMVALGRMPVAGDKVEVGPLEVTVEGMKGPRIAGLSVRRRPEPVPAAE
jgi:CBS domain containing-hemolysin-like protein